MEQKDNGHQNLAKGDKWERNLDTGKLIKKYKAIPVQVRASFWFLVCSFLQKGISVITTPIFTRLLSTSEYGQFSVFNSWLGILTAFVSLNLYSGVFTSGLVKFEENRARFTSCMQGLCTTLVAAWTAVYLVARNFWNSLFTLTTVQMLAMLVMIWATAAFTFWAGEQRVDFKYRALLIVTLIASVAKPAVGIVFVILAEDKVTARILGLALVEVMAYTGLYIAQMRRGGVFFSKSIWKYALSFNIPLVPHYLSMTILSSSDRIMIASMVGTSAAGIYGLAYSISQVMTLFSTALLQTVEPWLYKKIKQENLKHIEGVAYPSFALIATVNILLIAAAPEIVDLFAPVSYHNAIWIVPSVSMSVFFSFLYSYFATFEFYYKMTGFIAAASVMGAVLNILLNYLFIPVFGYYAAGYTTLVCYMVYSACHYLGSRYVCKKYMTGSPYNLKVLLLLSVAFLAVGFAFLFSYYSRWVRYGLIAVIILLLILFRKRIISFIKSLVNVRREGKK